MNTVVTSREKILKISRELIQSQGWKAVNIRSVATACGVSVGSIYYYFDSKTSLISATVESVWMEIFHHPVDESVLSNIEAYISWLYSRMEYESRKYPGFFTLHSLGFLQEDKEDGKEKMQQAWNHIRQSILSVLKNDPRIRPDAFSDQFTAEQFANVLFSLMLSALLREEYDPSAVLEIVRRTVF